MNQAILVSILFILFSQSIDCQTFTQSTLPIVVIETNDEEIPDEPKIEATMGIIDNGAGVINLLSDPFNEYNGNIGIETRGNSTQGFEKKTYTVELWDEPEEEISAPLLGMGGEEDWILHAMVIDKTQLRIPMSFDIFRRMGHYAAHYRYVEVVLNGEYQGVYILTENVKRDDDRVDIAKLDSDDIAGDSLTGGYILRIDWLWDAEEEDFFESEYESQGEIPMSYQWYYPKTNNIQQEQKEYISNYIGEFENAVFASDYTNASGQRYTDYIDLNSFVDFIIINEFSKNADGYKLSSYLHKDKDSKGGKLTAGPIWDFDQTYGMSTVCSNHIPTGWTYLQNQEDCGDLESMPLWWQAMMSDPVFTNRLNCRWETFRNGFLHQDSVFQWIDTQTAFLETPLERNFERWDFIGENIWIEPSPIPESYEEEISYMKGWITQRLQWLDANIPGNCVDDISSVSQDFAEKTFSFTPNPTNGQISLSNLTGKRISIQDATGHEVFSNLINGNELQLNLGHLSAGVYFITEEIGNKQVTKKLVIL